MGEKEFVDFASVRDLLLETRDRRGEISYEQTMALQHAEWKASSGGHPSGQIKTDSEVFQNLLSSLMENEKSKVKLLCIQPSQRLSLQKHKHRSETWYVVSGEAKVTKGNERFSLRVGDSVIIEKNEEHRVENISNKNLEIIEIQTGSYFGEDDIIRLQDSYGRADLH